MKERRRLFVLCVMLLCIISISLIKADTCPDYSGDCTFPEYSAEEAAILFPEDTQLQELSPGCSDTLCQYSWYRESSALASGDVDFSFAAAPASSDSSLFTSAVLPPEDTSGDASDDALWHDTSDGLSCTLDFNGECSFIDSSVGYSIDGILYPDEETSNVECSSLDDFTSQPLCQYSWYRGDKSLGGDGGFVMFAPPEIPEVEPETTVILTDESNGLTCDLDFNGECSYMGNNVGYSADAILYPDEDTSSIECSSLEDFTNQPLCQYSWYRSEKFLNSDEGLLKYVLVTSNPTKGSNPTSSGNNTTPFFSSVVLPDTSGAFENELACNLDFNGDCSYMGDSLSYSVEAILYFDEDTSNTECSSLDDLTSQPLCQYSWYRSEKFLGGENSGDGFFGFDNPIVDLPNDNSTNYGNNTDDSSWIEPDLSTLSCQLTFNGDCSLLGVVDLSYDESSMEFPGNTDSSRTECSSMEDYFFDSLCDYDWFRKEQFLGSIDGNFSYSEETGIDNNNLPKPSPISPVSPSSPVVAPSTPMSSFPVIEPSVPVSPSPIAMPSIIETNPSVPPPAESTSSPIVQSSPSIPITSNSTPPIFSSPVVLSSPLSCPLNFNGDCSLLGIVDLSYDKSSMEFPGNTDSSSKRCSTIEDYYFDSLCDYDWFRKEQFLGSDQPYTGGIEYDSSTPEPTPIPKISPTPVASNSAPVDSPIVMPSTIPIVPSPSILPPTSISSPLVQPSFVPLTSVSSSYVVSPSAPSVKPSTSKNSSPVEIPGNYSLPNVPHCSTNCSWNGECIGNEICDCKNGFGGIDCSIFVCNGKLSSDPLACGDNGLCTGPNTCTCKSEDYTGPWCDEFVCGLYQRNDPRVCSGKGSCKEKDVCQCIDGYFGANCEIFTCSGIMTNSSIICSGKGKCSSPDKCECNNGYTGTNCEIPVCHSKRGDEPTACSGHGTCTAFDTCSCLLGWTGLNCEIPICNGYQGSNACSKRGACVAPDLCVCDSGYKGIDCEISLCFGSNSTDTQNVCSGNGKCLEKDTCSCHTGYSGSDCSLPVCYGKVANEPNVCGGKGKCTSKDNCVYPICNGKLAIDQDVCSGSGDCTGSGCVCKPGYSGNDCEIPICFEKPKGPLACNGRGVCSASNKCDCDAGYGGIECEFNLCNGKTPTDPSVCSGNGVCVGLDKCECKVGYEGDDCEKIVTSLTCNGKYNADPTVCNGRGICTSLDTCQCKPGFSGTFCEISSCLGLPSTDENVCNKNGTCTSTDTCVCETKYVNNKCEEHSCNGKLASNPEACSGNGVCFGLDKCSCLPGFTGNNCEKFDCFGLSNISPSTCSSKGKCATKDKCTCNSGFTGLDCSIPVCNGVPSNDSSVCSRNGMCGLNVDGEPVCKCNEGWSGSNCDIPICTKSCGNGICKAPNVCECKNGFVGDKCDTHTCSGKLPTDPSVCSSRGSCVGLNTCFCNGGKYSGSECEVELCFGKPKNMTGVCSGHGLCESPDVCKCQPGYKGSECQYFHCDDVDSCSYHGTCVGPNTCQCASQFTGSDCSQPVCYGKSVNACSGSGTCERDTATTTVCKCNPGYFGTECEIPSCKGLIASDPKVCSGIGMCNSLDNCTCNQGYTGNNCETPICFGVIGSSACNGNGDCIGYDQCKCKTGYTGPNCERHTCNGVDELSPSVCSSHGSCIGPGKCLCKDGFEGKYCEYSVCSEKTSLDPSACRGRGTCYGGVCNCKAAYSGGECEFSTCNGKNSSSSTVCSGHGACIDTDTCVCASGYTGSNCEQSICFGKVDTDITVCSGRGLCVSPGKCDCKVGYYGSNCENSVCFGKNDTSGCYNNGNCIDVNTCSCNDGYFGIDCRHTVCSGYKSTEPKVCSGNGQCISKDKCSCKPGYGGKNCEFYQCFGKVSSDPDTCNGRGLCVDLDTCDCQGRYIGSKCEIPLCFGIPANDTNSCSQKGLCLDNNKCECSAGFTGDKCQFIDATDPSRECKGEFVLSNQFSLIGNKLYFVMVMLDISCGKTVSSNKVEIYSDVNIPPSTVAKYKDNNELLRDLITTTTDKKTGTVYITLNNDMLSNPPKDYIIIKKIDTIGNDVYVSELILTAPDNKPLPVTKIDKLIRDESTGSTYAVTTEKDVDGNSKVIVTYIDELNNKIIPVGVIEQETTKDQLSTSTVEGSKLIIPGKINTNTETLSVITLNKDKPVTVITNTLPPSISTNGNIVVAKDKQGTEYVIVASDSGLDVYKVNPSLETGKDVTYTKVISEPDFIIKPGQSVDVIHMDPVIVIRNNNDNTKITINLDNLTTEKEKTSKTSTDTIPIRKILPTITAVSPNYTPMEGGSILGLTGNDMKFGMHSSLILKYNNKVLSNLPIKYKCTHEIEYCVLTTNIKDTYNSLLNGLDKIVVETELEYQSADGSIIFNVKSNLTITVYENHIKSVLPLQATENDVLSISGVFFNTGMTAVRLTLPKQWPEPNVIKIVSATYVNESTIQIVVPKFDVNKKMITLEVTNDGKSYSYKEGGFYYIDPITTTDDVDLTDIITVSNNNTNAPPNIKGTQVVITNPTENTITISPNFRSNSTQEVCKYASNPETTVIRQAIVSKNSYTLLEKTIYITFTIDAASSRKGNVMEMWAMYDKSNYFAGFVGYSDSSPVLSMDYLSLKKQNTSTITCPFKEGRSYKLKLRIERVNLGENVDWFNTDKFNSWLIIDLIYTKYDTVVCTLKQELPYSYIEYKTITEQRNYTLALGQSATCAELGTENSLNPGANMTVVVDNIGTSCEGACNGASATVPSLSSGDWKLFVIIGGSVGGGILLVLIVTPIIVVAVYFARKKKLMFVYDEDKSTLQELFEKLNDQDNEEEEEETDTVLFDEDDEVDDDESSVPYRKFF